VPVDPTGPPGASAAAGRRAAGWEAMDDARWREARAAFEAAVDAERTPEALEGLSWAAWWLDDATTVFAARKAAFRLYRQLGQPAAAARMATWLAVDQLDFRGAWPVAQGWLARAQRLLDRLEPTPEHGWLAFQEGYLAHAAGDTATATRLAAEAVEAGRRFEVADLEMLGLALEGATLVACARVEEGMRRLDEATTAALEEDAEIPISGAWTFCFLVSACTAVRDFERARVWCDRIAAFADRFGSRYMLAFCRAEYGAVHLGCGRWPEAEAMLEASIEDFERSRPAWTSAPLVGLAELRRRQGRLDEAERLLDRAGLSTKAQVCRASIALVRRSPRDAAEIVERLLRQVPDDRGVDRLPALELLVHARAACGDVAGAAASLTALRAAAEPVGTVPLRAAGDLAEGAVAAAAGEHERARALFEDAVDGFVRSRAPYEAAQARLRLAATLTALGRDAAAADEAAAAESALAALRAADLEPGDAHALATLTPREREVLRLVAEGRTNRQIAAELVVSEHTVHRHISNLLRKLGLPTRTAAAAVAIRAGLVPDARVWPDRAIRRT
jgi:LuxR family maltose regulon positive regulatory protein